MINAALKAFAEKGYKKANTDDMVKSAGISKGLLFHYFISKQGLYEFVCEYSSKYIIMELSACVDKNATDYFVIREQVERARCNAMQNFPYMQRFLKVVETEKNEDIMSTAMRTKDELAAAYFHIYEQASQRNVRDISFDKIADIVEYTLDGLLADHLRADKFSLMAYQKDAADYLDKIRKLCEYSAVEE